MIFWTLVIVGMLLVKPFRKFAFGCISMALVAWGAIMILSFIG